ncbi:MAG: cytochrome c-type biogenesis protein CcmH [Candidatus Puniceispirillales bacterium]|tara:strand:+ start:498 stop:887 length:390 start_codon:yes stop_codon:yes gene_type:complete
MKNFLLIFFFFLVIDIDPSFTVEPNEIISNPIYENRARDLSKGIRCLVCQNQSIDDSDSDLAKDLRRIIRKKIIQGETDNEITQYLVDKYGNFILMKPPLYQDTYILWISPLLLMLVGITIMYFTLKRK